LAGVATLLILLLGVMIAAAGRLVGGSAMAGLARIAGLGYAIPGTVLAIGLLWPIASLDNMIADRVRGLFGISPGSCSRDRALPSCWPIWRASSASRSVGSRAGWRASPTRIDDAARALGRRPREVLSEIHLPLLRPSILAAALLVFVDCCKELPATLLLRPLNLETLATSVYADASRGMFEDGSLAALLIVLVGLGPVIIAARPRTMDGTGQFDRDREFGALFHWPHETATLPR
jgi:iron(III) transport system permease protein